MSDESDPSGPVGEQRELRAMVEAGDAENATLRAELAAALDRGPRLELRVAELERRLSMDSSNSGTPSSKEPIGAKERRKAERRNRQDSETGAAQAPQAGRAARASGHGPVPGPGPRRAQERGSAGSVLAVRDCPWRTRCITPARGAHERRRL